MSDVALEILKYPEKCQLDYEKCFALYMACCYDLTDVALEILKYPEKCYLDKIIADGQTILEIACERKVSKVALKIMKCLDKLNLNHVIDGYTAHSALVWACTNEMEEVAHEILKYPNQ